MIPPETIKKIDELVEKIKKMTEEERAEYFKTPPLWAVEYEKNLLNDRLKQNKKCECCYCRSQERC